MSKPLLAAAAGALALAAGAAHAQPPPAPGDGPGPGAWDWRGADAGRPVTVLVGPGVRFLIPELRDSPRGRAFVMRNFDFNGDGLVEPNEARAADRAFLDAAGADRAHFDWERRWHDPAFAPPPPPPPAANAGWDRPAMRAYHFRQNSYGAVFSLGDVLFETASAHLRPAALARLRPLAAYLRANPGQRLRIDGYTDSVGGQQLNLILSQDRARGVADALAAMGVNPSRFQLQGHGEASPAASNATAAGRQLNRRVEVTLVGRRAADFD